MRLILSSNISCFPTCPIRVLADWKCACCQLLWKLPPIGWKSKSYFTGKLYEVLSTDYWTRQQKTKVMLWFLKNTKEREKKERKGTQIILCHPSSQESQNKIGGSRPAQNSTWAWNHYWDADSIHMLRSNETLSLLNYFEYKIIIIFNAV